jgi:hypothetical protein
MLWPQFRSTEKWEVAINPRGVAYLRADAKDETTVLFIGGGEVTLAAQMGEVANALVGAQLQAERPR